MSAGLPLELVAAPFFVLRAPLLPASTLTEWGTGLEAAHASAADFERAAASDQLLLTARLRELVTRPEIREALLCASRSLHDAIAAWLEDSSRERAAGVSSILTRYLSRMAGRATPFGLFSSCGVGTVSPGPSRMWLGGRQDLVRHTRLDMQYLSALPPLLEQDQSLRRALRYFRNSGMYRVGDHIHYVEATIESGLRSRNFRLLSVEVSDELQVALERANAGATCDEIADALLAGGADLGREAALGFVDELIDSQLLVSELFPPISGPEPIDHLIDRLEQGDRAPAVTRALKSVRAECAAMDARGLGQDDRSYRSVIETLSTLPPAIDASRLFQIDLVRRDVGARLGSDVLTELKRGLELARRIATPRVNQDLLTFQGEFVRRYGAREIPLCEALDEEMGIGFGRTSRVPSELIENLRFPSRDARRSSALPTQAFLARKLLELERLGQKCWQLDANDLLLLDAQNDEQLPDTCVVMATLSSTSEAALQRGDFRLVFHGLVTDLGMMLGRFCHADVVLREAVTALFREEEARRPDSIFAEIVHLPDGRAGNVLCRPTLRRHDIPLLGASALPSHAQIPVEDLLVSVDRTEVVRLRSRRLGRWVEPRMASAQNAGAAASLGTFRFLCAVRDQSHSRDFNWGWGDLAFVQHLPEVRVGRLVLALEQWNVSNDDLAPARKVRGVQRFKAIQEMRARLGLPRWVTAREGADNFLPVDLDNLLSCESFVELTKQDSFVELMAFDPEEAAAQSEDGPHVAQIVVPFITKAQAPEVPIVRTMPADRSFTPGSEWLFAKLYCGPATADDVLREVVAPFVHSLLERGLADGWFFIRYNDPLSHLRLRIHGEKQQLLASVLPELHRMLEPWLASGRVYRVALDTYERELERYGGIRRMRLCEAIFQADSESVLELVRFDAAQTAPESRWRFALYGMHRILVDLRLPLEARLEVVSASRAFFAREYALDTAFDRSLGAQFRPVRAELERLVLGEPLQEGLSREGVAILNRRSVATAALCDELVALSPPGEEYLQLTDLASSLTHMHANRVLTSEQRAQELILNDYLMRIYESQAARKRAAAPQAAQRKKPS